MRKVSKIIGRTRSAKNRGECRSGNFYSKMNMQKRLRAKSKTAAAVLFLAITLLFPQGMYAAEPDEIQTAIPGGITFGARLIYPEIMIAEVSSERDCPAKLSGLEVGDLILSVNGIKISTPEELSTLINKNGSAPLKIEYMRKGEKHTASVQAVKKDGIYRIGVSVKNSSAGIGTVTFILPDGRFGGLGHGICCKETGALAPMVSGDICEVEIRDLIRGKAGAPGEIRGVFTGKTEGVIRANTACGVYGLYAEIPSLTQDEIEIARPSEVKAGKASIISTLGSDGPQVYEIEITEIFEPRAKSEKGFQIKVTDAKLIERTGGIIQGMSGSPIIQNGKLIGAVTHVMVGDPTSGYGIFIENMLAQVKSVKD